jgi:SNF2 family DNA or RNA helicase
LYDLTVGGHPSFSVNGILAHNSSKAKSPKAQTTKSLIKFADLMDYVYLFSGTPAPNSKMEYFPQIRMVSNVFGHSFYRFRSQYFYSFGYGNFQWKERSDRQEEFLSKLGACSQVVRKDDVLDLPERTINIRKVYLDRAERAAYQEMENNLLVELEENTIVAANSAVKVMKLREGTSGFYFNEDKTIVEVGTSKLAELKNLIEEIGDHQIIIWYHFRHEGNIIGNMLTEAGIPWARVDGEITRQQTRIDSIKDFKDGKIKILIAHPASLGHGVTLVNCSYAIYFSMSHSLELHVQSMDRIYRKGQHNACSYYFLVADGTIDEAIIRALDNKQEIVNFVFQYLKRKEGFA